MTPHFLSKELNFSPENFLWANSKNFFDRNPHKYGAVRSRDHFKTTQQVQRMHEISTLEC